MYYSDKMFKDYYKNIVFMDCQMHYCWYLFEKKIDHFDFLPSFYWTPCQHLYMINRYWTTFETLVEIEREGETAKNDNSAWEIVYVDRMSFGWLFFGIPIKNHFRRYKTNSITASRSMNAFRYFNDALCNFYQDDFAVHNFY